jgi:ABC-type cobalamin/Fe3+-siderophores transport system ATPase subunit
MQIFEILRGLSRTQHVTVVLVTHNINLAARYATHLLLIDRGVVAAQGAPADVIDRTIIERVYGWPVSLAAHPGPGEDAGAPQVTPLALDERDGPAL